MKHLIVPFLLVTIAHAENPAGIPADYRLLHAQDFAKPEATTDFLMTDFTAWSTSIAEGKAALELTKQSKYEPPFRSPFNIALLNGKSFGDVVFEADYQQTGKEYGHRDMVFGSGYQDPAHFYSTHIATAVGSTPTKPFPTKP